MNTQVSSAEINVGRNSSKNLLLEDLDMAVSGNARTLNIKESKLAIENNVDGTSNDATSMRDRRQLLRYGGITGMDGIITGTEFMVHAIEVSVGEDVIKKLLSSFKTGPRCIFIMSANGAISTVTTHGPTSGFHNHLFGYQGLFEILNLSGSYLIGEDDTLTIHGFSAMLCGSHGHIFGGSIAGSLLAASPVQLVIGSFVVPDGYMKNPMKKHEDNTHHSGSTSSGFAPNRPDLNLNVPMD